MVQWELAVPYIPVQGSPGVFWESLGVGDKVFGREKLDDDGLGWVVDGAVTFA